MKLLYIANARIPTPRAYGLQIMKTCEAFMVFGMDVALVAPTRVHISPEDPFAYYRVTHRFPLTNIPVQDFLHWGSFGFLLSTILFSEKVRWMKVFLEADIIYSRDALLLAQYLLLGRTFIFEAHTKPTFIAALVARRAKRVVVISHGLRAAYEAAGVKKENITVAPDAVDERLFATTPERAEARRMLGLPLDANIALYAGHLYPRKGAGTPAAAAARIPDTLVVFVGGSPEELPAFRAQWGSVSNIRIVGHVPHNVVPAYLHAADALILPNSGKDDDASRFTSPMKLFEYMLSGTPIIASDVPAIREILDKTTALFVTPDDPSALAEAITRVFAQREDAEQRARVAQAKAATLTWEKRAETIAAVL